MALPAPPAQRSREEAPIPFVTKLIATGLFSGYMPFASGTFGTIVGIIVYLIPGFERVGILGSAAVLFFFIGVAVSAKVASVVGHQVNRDAALTKKIFQPGEHETPDPSIVVIDEIVGVWITLLFLPKSVASIVGAFILFRLFDVVKPYPAGRLERIPDGWGIMLDDVVAGIYANIVLHVVRFFDPALFG